MHYQALRVAAARRVRWVVVCAGLVVVVAASGAIKRPVKRPVYDPEIPAVELFDAIDEGLIEVTVIPKTAQEANLFVENKSGKPLSVRIPPAVAAVHVLKQLTSSQPGLFGPGNATGQPGGNGVNGQAQSVAGGVANNGMIGTGIGGPNQNSPFANGARALNNLPGGFLFSVEPEKVAQLPLKTVCLSHGRPDPRPQMTYKLVKLEDYTTNPVLQEVLKLYTADGIDPQAAQAAAWHLSDNLSWKALEAKQDLRLGKNAPRPYFTAQQLKAAQELMTKAQDRAKSAAQAPEPPKL